MLFYFGVMKNLLEVDRSSVCTRLWMPPIVHYEMVSFMLPECHLN